jgi:hypothetical protein
MSSNLMRSLVAIGVVLIGCGPRSANSVKVDAALETVVPSNTVLLAGTRLESLLKTEIYQKNFAERKIPQIDDFARRTGLDPRKDLWELLYASDGHRGVLLGRGKFADEMMEPNLEKQGATRFDYKGLHLYGNERGAVVLLSPTTAAAGDLDELHGLIDQRGKSSGPPPALAALLTAIPANAQFWAAYSGGPIHLPFDGSSPLSNLNKLAASVQTATLYFDLRDGLNGLMQADCASDEGAQQMEGALKALIGIGRLSVPKSKPELAQVYDTIRVTQEARRVKLYIEVPQAKADQFLGMWMGH